MTETRILTKHPKGLKGVNILQRRYELIKEFILEKICLLYTSPSPRDRTRSRMPSSA